MSWRDEEAERLATAMLQLEGRMTELVSVVRGMQLNGVLNVQLITLPTSGRYTLNTAVPVASIAVANHSASALVIATGPERNDAPVDGIGVQLVGAGRAAVLPLAGAVFTLYGAAGGQVSIQTYSIPQPPSFA